MPPNRRQQPTIARHQQPANMKLAEASDPQATHGNTLVMRSSLDGDEDQGTEGQQNTYPADVPV
jgi:hypothetical protein